MTSIFSPTSLFTIPAWFDKLPEFSVYKKQMIDAAYMYRAHNPSDSMSNMNGYQSPKLLHSIPEFNFLFTYLTQRVREAAVSTGLTSNIGISEAWVNFNDSRECMNFQHTHGGVISGIFYLSVPAGSGSLNLVNPGINPMWEGFALRSTPNHYTSEVVTVRPTEGMIVMWPSFLPHAVGTNSHDDARISIAFNTTIVEK